MRHNFLEDLDIKGHLQITKCYQDGSQEIVFDDHNIIVSGMGLGLAQMFSLSGPPTVLDYQIDRFQVGVSGSSNLEVVSTNELAGPLSSLSEYGDQARIFILSGNHALTLDNYNEAEWFGYIPQHKVSRVGPNSVRYTLTLDQDAANEIQRDGETVALNEVGLFMKNPLGDRFSLGEDTSVLVAYRYFSPIAKTTDFSLVFRWTLSF
jgi:hypothetical protein